jgi:sigma-B regulation protein RsbU (phosphoserine phosphatase)
LPESGIYYLVGLEGALRGVRLRVSDPVRVGPGECRALSPRDLHGLGPCVFRLEYVPATESGERHAASAAQLAKDASLHHARLRHDLALAAQIQRSFLPREVIAVDGIDLFAEYRAAYTVGGDFYDVFWVGPDRLAVFVGDISGKGVSAALLMARISSELRVAALAHVDPVTVFTAMNDATLGRGQPELFFTAVYFTLDVKTGEIVLANAGHTTPYTRRADGRVEPVTGGRACPVGILDEPGFTATRLHLDHGDSLVLYTDGVTEAANADGSFFGQDRLEACLAGAEPRTANVIAEHILRCVDAHAAPAAQNDDLTVFICQRSVGSGPQLQPRRGSSRYPAARVTKTT